MRKEMSKWKLKNRFLWRVTWDCNKSLEKEKKNENYEIDNLFSDDGIFFTVKHLQQRATN